MRQCRTKPSCSRWKSRNWFPDPAGTATVNAATSAGAPGSVPALPAHATSLRAFRSPGAPGHGGTGRHLDHDHRFTRRAGAGPLTPGVTYEFWLVGHNFGSDGPESNHLNHAVPVGP